MESQREIYQALIDGKTLVDNSGTTKRIDVVTGFLIDSQGDKTEESFYIPENWSEYKEPQWYDKIPEEGILCWVDSLEENNKNFCVKIKHFSGLYFVDTIGGKWRCAKPVKPEECYQGVK
jgi:hypothetical protein